MTGVQSRGSGRHSWLSGGHLSSPGTGFAASVLDERLEPDQISANLPAIETQSFADLFDQTGGLPIHFHGDPGVCVSSRVSKLTTPEWVVPSVLLQARR